mmetsp:Transcript_11157/g.30846  ORF Transcript_11157/g.30846 Transcript_11157/m.30846 type:complete len:240 (+) Transcript_11157:748-1467(+)
MLGNVPNRHFRLCADTALFMAQNIADATGHVQTRVALALHVDAMVRVSIENHLPSVFLDALTLILEVRFVITSQRLTNQTSTLVVTNNCSAVCNMRQSDFVRGVVMDGDGSGGARQKGTDLVHLVCSTDYALHLVEHIGHKFRISLGHKPVVPHDQLRERRFHKVGNMVSVFSMPVEDTVQRETGVYLQHAPRILVRTLRLQPLAARVAEPPLFGVDLVSGGASLLVSEWHHTRILLGT